MIRAYRDCISDKNFYFNLFGEAFERAGRWKDKRLLLSHVNTYAGGILRPDGVIHSG
jgi:hypothetical protein